jgi:hypothetical protein
MVRRRSLAPAPKRIPLRKAAAFILFFATVQAAAADDSQLVGLWQAVGQPEKMMEFSRDGTFRYVYSAAAPRAILHLRWKAGWFGKVTLSQEHGAGSRSCSVKVQGDSLIIDDGSGQSCIPNRPVEMLTCFTRAN